MVRRFNGIVHLTTVHIHVLTAQNMVDTEIETMTVIRNAQAIARFHECILQILTQSMVGI
jgi:hypothetical protein